MSLAGIDVIFLVIIAVSALRCAAHGFVSELLSMAALIFGLLAAIIFFRKVSPLVRDWFMPGAKGIPEVIAFAAIFLMVYIVVKIVEATLKNIIEGISLGGLDHFLGFLLGCAEGIIIVSLLLFLLSVQRFFDPNQFLENSLFAKIILPLITGGKKEALESVVILKTMGGRSV